MSINKQDRKKIGCSEEQQSTKSSSSDNLVLTGEDVLKLWEQHKSDFHPLANIFPLMQSEELSSLANDIQEKGQCDPIIRWKGKIADGRNRYLACEALGINCKSQDWPADEASLKRSIISKNSHRRDLTASQRAATAVELEELYSIEAKQIQIAAGKANLKSGKSSSPGKIVGTGKGEDRLRAAKDMRVSASYVSQAKRVKKLSPQLLEQVKAGIATLQEALAPKKHRHTVYGPVDQGEFEEVFAEPEKRAIHVGQGKGEIYDGEPTGGAHATDEDEEIASTEHDEEDQKEEQKDAFPHAEKRCAALVLQTINFKTTGLAPEKVRKILSDCSGWKEDYRGAAKRILRVLAKAFPEYCE